MPKPLPEIKRCKCGSIASVEPALNFYAEPGIPDMVVECEDCESLGPVRKDANAAILAWNRAQRHGE